MHTQGLELPISSTKAAGLTTEPVFALKNKGGNVFIFRSCISLKKNIDKKGFELVTSSTKAQSLTTKLLKSHFNF